jgi:hypothetical protein
MEALRKIVSGSVLEPLFSLPYSSRELQYEVIVLPVSAGAEQFRDNAARQPLVDCLRGALGDIEFDCTRKITAERGTPVEIFN